MLARLGGLDRRARRPAGGIRRTPTPAPAPASDDGSEAEDRDGTRSAAAGRVLPATPPKWLITTIVVALIGLVILSWVGDALAPDLVNSNPLLLIAMNARVRNLVLVVNQVDVWLFFTVATVRLLVSDPLFYLLGWWYGDAAVGWIERRSRTFGRYARDFERYFQKAAYPLVAIAPNNPICLLAGASGMRPIIFFALNLVGTLVRLWLIVILGEAFESPIEWVLDFIAEYRVYLLVLSFSIVGITAFRELRTGEGEIQSIREARGRLDEMEEGDET
ncbi:MAG: hypothetical protein U5R31_12380 [Acidimicrobiia bacterium]|nr:hypothetical protein [Acidimicrobiia bacterium]